MKPFFPVALNLAGRRCVVVGEAGDREAIEKEAALREAGADVAVIVPSALAESDVAGAFFVISTPQDAALSQKLRELSDRHGFLLCCIDQPDFGFVAMAAIAKAGPVRIAFSTTGQAPAIAKRLRERMQAVMDARFERFIDAISQKKARAREQHPGPEGFAARRAANIEAAADFDAEISLRYPTWFEDDALR